MRLGFLLPIFSALYSTVDAAILVEGRQSALDGTSGTILTPDVVQLVQEIVEADGIPGLTLAIVHKSKPAEFGAWGIKSENGTNMTTDVGYARLFGG
jgi:CubicO group peptidase (beta-lactamase class C family)